MLDDEGQKKLISNLSKLLRLLDNKEPFARVKELARQIIDFYTGDDGSTLKTKLARRTWERDWPLYKGLCWGWFPDPPPDDAERPKADALRAVFNSMAKLLMDATTTFRQETYAMELRQAAGDYLALHGDNVISRADGAPAAQRSAPIGLDEEDWKILRALQKAAPRLQTTYDLATGTRIGRKTVGNRLAVMIAKGWAERPNGKRAGATITGTGRELLRKPRAPK